MNWTRTHNNKPTVGFLDFAVEDGALCGVVESGEEHGSEAARISKQILRGKKAGDFPVRTAQKGTVMLNSNTARKLGIEIKVVSSQ